MPASFNTKSILILFALLFLLGSGPELQAQIPPQPQSKDQTDVLRVYTELVQTDVMVFDKQGNFVNGLRKDDFELKIDGKKKQIDFFEKVTAGTVSEESQLAAARGSSNGSASATTTAPSPLDRGRPVFFYVDDLHLDLAGLKATRKLIFHFIENEMGQNDEAAISSASGQVGFLQQLTDDKAVLRAALERLKIRPYSVRDPEHPIMTEYQALLVDNYDRDVREYFITETIRLNPGMTRDSAENLVSSRARSLLHQAAHVTTNTLAGLESLIRSANQLPGRKLVFFISGGFFLDSRNSDGPYKLQRITSAAARSGVVIYSMDARGLVASLQDASSESQFDPTGSLSRAAGGELLSSQNGMNALARDTGGKAIYNTNALETRLARVLKETSAYYLLAWKPEHQAQHAGRFRHIEVRVVGKPELTVHVRRGFFDVEPAEPQEAKSKKPPEQPPKEMTPAAQLRKVIGAPYPDRGIPISLSLNYMSVPNKGLMLAANLQIPNEFISLTAANGRQTGAVDVAGVFLNDRGQPGATFGNRLTIDAPSTQPANGGQDVAYGFPVYLGPGLYQVRVGARDEKSGRMGSAHAWIEIPDFSSGQLMLSSLLIGARAQPILTNASANTKIASDGVALSVDHRFSSNSYLRFLVFVYNAARAPSDSKPDVAIQLQVVRDQQPVITTPLKKISTDAIEDLNSLPYAAEISLSDLPTGRYLLRVTAVDRVTKRSASQQTRFDIEQ